MKSFLIVLSGLLASAAGNPNQVERIIYLSTPLTGTMNRKSLVQAIDLFIKTNPKLNLRLMSKDNHSDFALSTRQINEFVVSPKPKIIFGPSGSEASHDFVLANQNRSQADRKKTFFLNQVTASPELNSEWPTVNSFFSTDDYLKGLVDLLLGQQKRPKKVHIFCLSDLAYLDEVVSKLRGEFEKNKLQVGLDLKVHQVIGEDIVDQWRKALVQKDDWVFLVTYLNPNSFLKLKGEKNFQQVLKVMTYGKPDSISLQDKWFYKNSWQILFWHPELEYLDSGPFSNCQFSETFFKRFKHEPDFHGAFAYSALEAASRLGFENPFLNHGGITALAPIQTMMGPMLWGRSGLRLDVFPIILKDDGEKRRLYIPPQIKGVCKGSLRWLQNVDITKWPLK